MSTVHADRRAALRNALLLGTADGVLISHAPDIRWLTGFTGSSALLLLGSNVVALITDGRYTAQVAKEAPDLPAHIGQGAPGSHVGGLLEEYGLTHVYLQSEHVSWSSAKKWAADWDGVTLGEMGDQMKALRASKSTDEADTIRRALAITERVLSEVFKIVEEGITEREVAAEIDHLHRQYGASGPAFDTIVAFSENAALPHARPSERRLKSGDCILIDCGGVVEGYHSDMTRTIVFGGADKDFLEGYEAVRSALLRSQEAAHAGMSGEDLDGVAREALTRHGYGSAFSHSLGHGVGLEIHESPSVSRRNQHPLPEGCIITLEPAIYLPGRFGIRIENMAQLTAQGAEIMNSMDTELIRL